MGRLQDSSFLISIDEISDINGTVYLAISVRYFEQDILQQPVTKLLSILPMGDSSTGETLYNKVKEEVLISKDVEKNL